MFEILLIANVKCTDGHAGRCISLIIDSRDQMVKHLVIKGAGLLDPERLVPFHWVKNIIDKSLCLSGTKAELAQLNPLMESELWQKEMPDPNNFLSLTKETQSVIITHRRLLPGEKIIRHGACAEATDSRVGQVIGFLVEPDDGLVTHVMLELGHLWNKRTVSVPVSQIDHIEEFSVHLRIPKQVVEDLQESAIGVT